MGDAPFLHQEKEVVTNIARFLLSVRIIFVVKPVNEWYHPPGKTHSGSAGTVWNLRHGREVSEDVSWADKHPINVNSFLNVIS